MMKTWKIIEELNEQLDSAARCQRERDEQLRAFRRQLKNEEQKLTKIMKKVSENGVRAEIERQLGLVREGYELMA